jgi:hypothetical protein
MPILGISVLMSIQHLRYQGLRLESVLEAERRRKNQCVKKNNRSRMPS